MTKADIGLIGLAVMGENLILNMESKGFTVPYRRWINLSRAEPKARISSAVIPSKSLPKI